MKRQTNFGKPCRIHNFYRITFFVVSGRTPGLGLRTFVQSAQNIGMNSLTNGSKTEYSRVFDRITILTSFVMFVVAISILFLCIISKSVLTYLKTIDDVLSANKSKTTASAKVWNCIRKRGVGSSQQYIYSTLYFILLTKSLGWVIVTFQHCWL